MTPKTQKPRSSSDNRRIPRLLVDQTLNARCSAVATAYSTKQGSFYLQTFHHATTKSEPGRMKPILRSPTCWRDIKIKFHEKQAILDRADHAGINLFGPHCARVPKVSLVFPRPLFVPYKVFRMLAEGHLYPPDKNAPSKTGIGDFHFGELAERLLHRS